MEGVKYAWKNTATIRSTINALFANVGMFHARNVWNGFLWKATTITRFVPTAERALPVLTLSLS